MVSRVGPGFQKSDCIWVQSPLRYFASHIRVYFWYKHQPVKTYADGELAYTSFKKTAKCFDYPFFGGTGADEDGRIHPTQKPVALYTWILQNYAKPGDKILDTHLGSGSSRIAAYEQDLDFVGFELEKSYFDAQEERFQAHISQLSLFHMEEFA